MDKAWTTPPAPCHARTPVRIKHTSRRRRHLPAPRRRLTSSGGPTRRTARTGRNIALFIGSRDGSAAIGTWPYSLRVGTDRPRSEHRPFRSGRWPHGEVGPTGHSRHAVGRAGLHEKGDVPLSCLDSLCTAERYKTRGGSPPGALPPNSDDAAETGLEKGDVPLEGEAADPVVDGFRLDNDGGDAGAPTDGRSPSARHRSRRRPACP